MLSALSTNPRCQSPCHPKRRTRPPATYLLTIDTLQSCSRGPERDTQTLPSRGRTRQTRSATLPRSANARLLRSTPQGGTQRLRSRSRRSDVYAFTAQRAICEHVHVGRFGKRAKHALYAPTLKLAATRGTFSKVHGRAYRTFCLVTGLGPNRWQNHSPDDSPRQDN